VLWTEAKIGVLRMNQPAVVRIIGAPIACAEGVKDSWRELAMWFAGKLQARYGEAVQVQYWDLFDPGCPPLPPDAQLPLVMINDEFISRGQKISLPAIRAHLEAIGLQPRGH
jgi:disulfide oxidoreductase YuzD